MINKSTIQENVDVSRDQKNWSSKFLLKAEHLDLPGGVKCETHHICLHLLLVPLATVGTPLHPDTHSHSHSSFHWSWISTFSLQHHVLQPVISVNPELFEPDLEVDPVTTGGWEISRKQPAVKRYCCRKTKQRPRPCAEPPPGAPPQRRHFSSRRLEKVQKRKEEIWRSFLSWKQENGCGF